MGWPGLSLLKVGSFFKGVVSEDLDLVDLSRAGPNFVGDILQIVAESREIRRLRGALASCSTTLESLS
jgi:hypothetical protein